MYSCHALTGNSARCGLLLKQPTKPSSHIRLCSFSDSTGSQGGGGLASGDVAGAFLGRLAGSAVRAPIFQIPIADRSGSRRHHRAPANHAKPSRHHGQTPLPLGRLFAALERASTSRAARLLTTSPATPGEGSSFVFMSPTALGRADVAARRISPTAPGRAEVTERRMSPTAPGRADVTAREPTTRSQPPSKPSVALPENAPSTIWPSISVSCVAPPGRLVWSVILTLAETSDGASSLASLSATTSHVPAVVSSARARRRSGGGGGSRDGDTLAGWGSFAERPSASAHHQRRTSTDRIAAFAACAKV